jgi:hypothetical protein
MASQCPSCGLEKSTWIAKKKAEENRKWTCGCLLLFFILVTAGGIGCVYWWQTDSTCTYPGCSASYMRGDSFAASWGGESRFSEVYCPSHLEPLPPEEFISEPCPVGICSGGQILLFCGRCGGSGLIGGGTVFEHECDTCQGSGYGNLKDCSTCEEGAIQVPAPNYAKKMEGYVNKKKAWDAGRSAAPK